MITCNACGAAFGELATRTVFLDEIQVCHWNDNLPEVEIQSAQVLGDFCCKSCASSALDRYLSKIGAIATWADVRPIETCAICAKHFSTERPHRTLTLSEETGPETGSEMLYRGYPARFCPDCTPRIGTAIEESWSQS